MDEEILTSILPDEESMEELLTVVSVEAATQRSAPPIGPAKDPIKLVPVIGEETE